MTGKNVTECVGGIIEVTEEKLETGIIHIVTAFNAGQALN